VPDERWGEAVLAIVALKDGKSATAQDIIDHCHRLIANYKCPRHVEFREALPLSGAGKIMKNVLREPYWQGRARAVG
jgi:long-chain acyl-CoA synthetase